MRKSTSGFEELQRRGFQSLMLSSRIKTLEKRGQLPVILDVPVATALLGRFEDFVPNALVIRLGSVAHAFAIFYCFENMARALVSERLEETKGAGWWNVTATVPNAVKARVKSLRDKADENKWHDVEANSDMDYTLFSDLIAIIDANWLDFKELFPDQLWIKTRLGELEMSRNAIMHGRMLPPSEIARIEQYFDDWIDQVG